MSFVQLLPDVTIVEQSPSLCDMDRAMSADALRNSGVPAAGFSDYYQLHGVTANQSAA